MNKSWSWLLALGLALLGAVFLTFGFLRKLERDQLFLLEDSMVTTARAIMPEANRALEGGEAQLKELRKTLQTTQNATGSRIRVLDRERNLVADSLPQKEPQQQLRFRPEIQAAFTGQYGAFTRFSDETERSLALFVALPIPDSGGAVYVSHTTDEILQQLGVLRRAANRVLLGLAGALFVGAILMTGKVRKTVSQLRRLTGGVSTSEPELVSVEGDEEVAEIGENINRLIASLRQNIADLEQERSKTKRFLEEVAHELKTPMTGIMGSLETLRDEEVGEDDRTRLWGNLEREAERLSALTSQLLELQKLDYQSTESVSFDLLSVAETVTDNFHYSAAQNEVALEVEESEETTAWGDPAQIQRVVENLVENAIRCSPKGGRINLKTTADDEGIRLLVSDQGPGPPSKEMFKRHQSGGKDGGSLGLGLSIASEVLKRHGSELEVAESEQGGSVFSFRLSRLTTT